MIESAPRAHPFMHLIRLARVLAGLACAAPSMAAQDTTSTRSGDWLVGASIGLPMYQSDPLPELFTVGVHWTQLRPGELGADISIGILPRAITFGAGVVGARVGAALPLELSPGFLLLPSGGLSLVGGAGNGGIGGAKGVNAGVAGVVLGSRSIGLRGGITWHWFGGIQGSVWLLELGLVDNPRRPR